MNAATVNKTKFILSLNIKMTIITTTQIPVHAILQVTVTLTAIAVTSIRNNLRGVANMTPTTSIL